MRKCLCCNKETTNPKFCSRSCSATITNKGVHRHGAEKQENKCLYCHKKFQYNPTVATGKFCSAKCYGDYLKNENKSRWLRGEWVVGMSRHTIHRYLVEERGNFCEGEGCSLKNEWLGKPLRLTVDHIDGNGGNHSPDNVRLLCPNCHSQTPTFTSKNKGNYRGSRGLSLG